MQKTIHVCDICGADVGRNETQAPALTRCKNGQKVVLCGTCLHVLTRARDLDIVLPDLVPIVIGGAFVVNPEYIGDS